jgi:DNA-binding MarR family transcriptional regulator
VISPALNEASTDTKLRGAPIQLLVYLHGKLDPGEYRPLKLWPIARDLGMEKATVGRAMKRLIECGYIREGHRQRPGGRSYLLLTTRGEPLKRTA